MSAGGYKAAIIIRVFPLVTMAAGTPRKMLLGLVLPSILANDRFTLCVAMSATDIPCRELPINHFTEESREYDLF